MAFRPPSLQKPYTLCSSYDPALNLPVIPTLAEDASAEDKAARDKLLEERTRLYAIACDTGNWSAITKPNEHPTQFECRPIHGAKTAWLSGEISRAQARGEPMSNTEIAQLAFRLGVTKVGLDGVTLETCRVEDFQLLTVDCLQPIYSIGRDIDDADLGVEIVKEIGQCILVRALGVRPLS